MRNWLIELPNYHFLLSFTKMSIKIYFSELHACYSNFQAHNNASLRSQFGHNFRKVELGWITRGVQINRLPPTNRLPNRDRSEIDRLPT
jgi:hypothetical protein